MRTEAETGGMWPQAKGPWSPGSRKRHEGSSLGDKNLSDLLMTNRCVIVTTSLLTAPPTVTPPPPCVGQSIPSDADRTGDPEKKTSSSQLDKISGTTSKKKLLGFKQAYKSQNSKAPNATGAEELSQPWSPRGRQCDVSGQ